MKGGPPIGGKPHATPRKDSEFPCNIFGGSGSLDPQGMFSPKP